MSASAVAERSPAAHRTDPPVRKWTWIDPGTSARAFPAHARERTGLDAAAWARVEHHQGVWVDGHRWPGPRDAGAHIPAGARVAVYAFSAEPEVPALSLAALLLDRQGVVAVDKPAWLPIQGTRASARISLETALRVALDCPYLTPAHRLDRQTSGVVLFARDRPTAAALFAAFRDRRVDKEYLARVYPSPEDDRFTVSGGMVRVAHPRHSRFALDPAGAGQPSETAFTVLRRSGPHALLRARPRTGRTHQIRVHLADRGHPIVGDTLYGPGWEDAAPHAADRVLLHAERVRVALGGRTLDVAAPVPSDMA